jgi:hypothetical protein
MSKELDAIVEYEAARLEIKRLGDEISNSTWTGLEDSL